MDTAAYQKMTTTATDMAKTLVEGQIKFFDSLATTAKGTPAASFFDAAAKMQRATLEGFESLSGAIANAPTDADMKKRPQPAEKPLKAAGKAMKKAVNAQADLMVNAGKETVAATAKTKDAVKKAAKSAKAGNIAALYDDLTAVTGIGPSTMKKLHAAGVHTIEDLAKTSKKDLSEIIESANVRMLKYTAADWIADAKSLVKSAKRLIPFYKRHDDKTRPQRRVFVMRR